MKPFTMVNLSMPSFYKPTIMYCFWNNMQKIFLLGIILALTNLYVISQIAEPEQIKLKKPTSTNEEVSGTWG